MDKNILDEVIKNHKLWIENNLTGFKADLSRANLRLADLRLADLSGADLRGANLDYSSWGLSCKTKNVKVDRKIASQIAAHFCVLVCDDPDYILARDAILDFAKFSHHAKELGLKD
jgi:uncharacterized protein YjbI with pentapeptide repeats